MNIHNTHYRKKNKLLRQSWKKLTSNSFASLRCSSKASLREVVRLSRSEAEN
uniref:Ovule protein n=1 Tax=Schistosoma curassoni TaxID=6186 RepID=A0A183KUN3_9TREM